MGKHDVKRPTAIVPRRLRLSLSAATPRHWLANDPIATHLLNALSATFPTGERWFVDSVRAYSDRVRDPDLRDDVRAFVMQEMHHGRAHEEFNAWLRGLGLPIDAIVARSEQETRTARERLTAEIQLAATCALEHFTAILAEPLLGSTGLLDSMHEDVRPIWLWHAIEETEHKAVAFDVYHHVGGRYPIRVATMAAVTLLFLGNTVAHTARVVRADDAANLGNLATFAWRFFGPRGHFRGLGAKYFDYYRPDFHPWEHDGSAELTAARARLDAWLARTTPTPGESVAA